MIWLTWRQHRQHMFVLAVVLMALAALYATLRSEVTGYVHDSGLAACISQPDQFCGDQIGGLRDRYAQVLTMLPFINLAPALLGLFVGAPLLAGEYEQGTHRLVWTQSVSRARWALVKLLGLSGVCAASGLVVGALDRWLLDPFIRTGAVSPVGQNFFGLLGLAPLGYALFAFAFGATAGALTRRTLPAMALTLVVFLLVRFGWESQRWHALSPVRLIYPLGAAHPPAGPGRQDWILPSIGRWADSSGSPISDERLAQWCGVAPAKDAFLACLQQHGVQQIQVYQPASRFWQFQWLELAIFAGLAVVLLTTAMRAALRRTA